MAELTNEEVKNKVLEHIKGCIDYWNEIKEVKTTKERLEGLAFSILTMIDGETELPAFILAPDPHKDDKSYFQENGEDWYPENHNSEIKGDISGDLHHHIIRD